ncbi:MAG: hypothetical protein NW206_01130 [Hyphomonadaceae bacterium]|nr:hypothetical protein [Hyphomonadaceae bacterium]
MLKQIAIAAATAAMMSLGACGQGPAEEAGEQADTINEQVTTGETDLGQGPMEEAGEQADEAADDGMTTTTTETTTTTTTP